MEDIQSKKILMTLMRLQIGGAETHVLELSLELKRQGFDVVVASGGGVYEKNLAEAGIRHYKVPMYTKRPFKMLQSLRSLRRIIRDEQIDIVHAHGRIPAFLTGILRHFMDFTFVTTAHWVFNTGHGLKYVSDWGEKVVAVSEDIKTYLMVNYHINPTDIYVTINGIDTNRFSPEADCSGVIQEYQLSPESKKIVYISRMDEDRALVAFQLAEIAPALAQEIPGLEIIIVGGGNVLDKLKELVKGINRNAGRNLVTLTGSRTDIDRFANLGDIFVGVSRSALEAMACAKPVIVAGNEGYIGIFDEDKLAAGIETNFCCRGLEASTPERLQADILKLFANPPEENQRLGNYGRELIIHDYSVSRMAGDAVRMYRAAVDPKRWDAVISGYYGYDNSGDEALLYAMIENLRAIKDDIRLCVLSKSPKKTAKEYGVYSINRYHALALKKAISSAKLLISGGGSLLQDVTSSKSLWYYLAVINCAKKQGTRVMVYANGLGPILRPKNREKARLALSGIDYITLREKTSAQECEHLQIRAKQTEITADPALTIVPVEEAQVRQLLLQEGIGQNTGFIGVSVRGWKNCRRDFVDAVAGALAEACKKYHLTPLFIPLKYPDDSGISEEIAAKTGMHCYVLKKRYGAREIVSIVGQCRAMLAMRLHSLIYAANMLVPTVGLSYDPKVSGFMEYLGLENTVSVETMTQEALAGQLETVLENHDAIQMKLQANIALLKEKAEKNAEIAYSLMREADCETAQNRKAGQKD